MTSAERRPPFDEMSDSEKIQFYEKVARNMISDIDDDISELMWGPKPPKEKVDAAVSTPAPDVTGKVVLDWQGNILRPGDPGYEMVAATRGLQFPTPAQSSVITRVKKCLGQVALVLAGAGAGAPIGGALQQAATPERIVEKVVEKVVKVPVPFPAPDPRPVRTICPRCGARLLIMPPKPGQTGDLPRESPDASPGRQGHPDHPADAGRRVPVPAQPRGLTPSPIA